MGSIIENNVGVVVGDFLEPIEEKLGTSLDGLLGYNFLGKRRITIDYSSEKIYLD